MFGIRDFVIWLVVISLAILINITFLGDKMESTREERISSVMIIVGAATVGWALAMFVSAMLGR